MASGEPFDRIGHGLAPDREPWVDEAVACERCGTAWVSVRSLACDHRRLTCHFCGAKDSNLEHEVGQPLTTKH